MWHTNYGVGNDGLILFLCKYDHKLNDGNPSSCINIAMFTKMLLILHLKC